MSKKLSFPKNFLWGVAISGYQTEGNSDNTDWWQWEQQGKIGEKSGRACDYWNKYKEDHELLSQLGCNTFRVGIEWSKVEPEEGVFSQENLAHYRELLQDLKKRNIKTQVTLWWWTSPVWFSHKYGFHAKEATKLFTRYAEKVVEELGEFIDMYQIFNEPMVPLGQGYLSGEFPPGQINPFRFVKALRHIVKAYKKTYLLIKKKYPDSLVGISYLYNWYEYAGLGPFVKVVNKIAKWYRIDWLGKKLKGYQDYMGIDYYRLGRMHFDPRNSQYVGFRIEEDKKNVMGWIANPEGMYKVLKEAWKEYQLPIYIIENGIPTNTGLDDQKRSVFLRENLKCVHQAISEGIDVRGYNHWSFMDNFEWLSGFKPRFGLVEIDFKTLERKPRRSFYEYAKICKNNELNIE